MSATALFTFHLRPDATNVDEVLDFDLPRTASFEGNELTEVLIVDGDPRTLHLLTRWTSDEAYAAYSAWRGSEEGATRVAEIAAGPPITTRFTSYRRY